MIIRTNDSTPLPKRQDAELEGFALHDAKAVRGHASDIDFILSYFEEKTGKARLPKRSDIVPTEIKHILPNVAILQFVFDAGGALDDVIVQLMGTTLSEFYGEQTGKSIFDYADQEVPNRIFNTCNYCLEKRRPVVSTAETFSADKPHLSAMSLLVPLSEDGTHIDRVFAYLSVCSSRSFGEMK